MASHWIDRGGEVWKNKAHSLQLQLRDRFRVVVDRRLRGRPIFSNDGYFSATFQRWLRRFRDLRREGLPSSSAFYRKRVAKDLKDEDSVILRMLQSVAVPVIGNVCHVFMAGLNHVQVYGVEKLHEALLNRPENKPLITVSNHVASVDDPFVIASLLPPSVLLDARNLRWTLCATDRCFKNPVTSAFFRSVKVLPVSRGDGIYQKGMDMAISKLNNGGWVHIFPEGSRSRDGGKTLGSPKRGIGRLILDSDNVPMVVPFVHTGMQEIMPIGASVPRIGKTVTVLVGDPIYFDDLLDVEETIQMSRGKLYDAVASRIGHRLHELKIQVDKLALQQSLESQWSSMQNTDRVSRIFHQVDWDSFGMGSYIATEDDLKIRQDAIVSQSLDEAPQTVPASVSSDRYLGVDFSYQPGFVSRMRGYMDQLELMGFAARGLFMNLRHKENPVDVRQIGPLRAWKQFLEANVVGQWSKC